MLLNDNKSKSKSEEEVDLFLINLKIDCKRSRLSKFIDNSVDYLKKIDKTTTIFFEDIFYPKWPMNEIIDTLIRIKSNNDSFTNEDNVWLLPLKEFVKDSFFCELVRCLQKTLDINNITTSKDLYTLLVGYKYVCIVTESQDIEHEKLYLHYFENEDPKIFDWIRRYFELLEYWDSLEISQKQNYDFVQIKDCFFLSSTLFDLYSNERINGCFNTIFKPYYIENNRRYIRNSLSRAINQKDNNIYRLVEKAFCLGFDRLNLTYTERDVDSWPDIQQINTPQLFAVCYLGTELHSKVLVPELIAKSLIERDSSMLSVLLPHLTDEVKITYEELMLEVENIDFISLVPMNEEVWHSSAINVINRGKQIYNNLHPDNLQVIPIDMEKVRLALHNEAPGLLPELPKEDAEATDTNNIEQSEKHTKVRKDLDSTKTTLHEVPISTIDVFKSLPISYSDNYFNLNIDHEFPGSNIQNLYASHFIKTYNEIVSNKIASHFVGFMYLLYISPCFNWKHILLKAKTHYDEIRVKIINNEGYSKKNVALINSYNDFDRVVCGFLQDCNECLEAAEEVNREDVDRKKAMIGYQKISKPKWNVFNEWSGLIFQYLFNVDDLHIIKLSFIKAESQAKKDLYNVYCRDNDKLLVNWKSYLKTYDIYEEEYFKKIKEIKEKTNENRKAKPRNKKRLVEYKDTISYKKYSRKMINEDFPEESNDE